MQRKNKTADARMVESVDTRDLKSLGYCSCVGSSPTPGTNLNNNAGNHKIISVFFYCWTTEIRTQSIDIKKTGYLLRRPVDLFIKVGLPRFELSQTEPKPVVLPLHHSPNNLHILRMRVQRYTFLSIYTNIFEIFFKNRQNTLTLHN